jgi:hypothetical protein
VDLARIFSCTSGLDRLIADTVHVPLDWDAFEALAKTSGETLVEMSRYSVKTSDFRIPRQPTIFLHFPALRSLKWDSGVSFSGGTPGQFSAALPALESLDVESRGIFSAIEKFECVIFSISYHSVA